MGSHAFDYPGTKFSPIDKSEFELMLRDPKVVHFTTEWKPWHYGITHPYRDDFYHTLDQTVWRGWRPSKPAFSLQKLIDKVMVKAIRKGTIVYRKMASAW